MVISVAGERRVPARVIRRAGKSRMLMKDAGESRQKSLLSNRTAGFS
ncbi:hypothetical protein [Variovorax rhizosphaerae]|uniref:Uncharacterized protein n=1 Tax=Variovorax rhizosphaerae TaxID=1836200 RepID=A0ABU8WJ38_9BURK